MNELTFVVVSAAIGVSACVRRIRPYAMVAGGLFCAWIAVRFLTTDYRRAEQMPEALTFVGLAIACFGLAWLSLRRRGAGIGAPYARADHPPSALRTLVCTALLLFTGPPVYCGAQAELNGAWSSLTTCVFYGFAGYVAAYPWMLLVVVVFVLVAGRLGNLRYGRAWIMALATVTWPLALHFPSMGDGLVPAALVGLVNGFLAAWILRPRPVASVACATT